MYVNELKEKVEIKRYYILQVNITDSSYLLVLTSFDALHFLVCTGESVDFTDKHEHF